MKKKQKINKKQGQQKTIKIKQKHKKITFKADYERKISRPKVVK